MEHLIYECDASTYRRGVRAAQDAEELKVDDWVAHEQEYGRLNPMPPSCPWLGSQDARHRDAMYSYTGNNVFHDRLVDCGLGYLLKWDEENGSGYLMKWDEDRGLDMHCDSVKQEGELEDAQQQLAQSLQDILYCGLLEVLLRKRVHASYVSRRLDDGNCILDSRNLIFGLGAWKDKFAQESVEVQKYVLADANRSAANVFESIMSLLFVTQRNSTRSSIHSGYEFPILQKLLKSIVPAIILLVEAVASVGTRIWQGFSEQFFGPSFGCTADARMERMTGRGWCPTLIWHNQIGRPLTTLSYIDAKEFKNPNGGHDNCTNDICNRNNINISTYKQRHAVRDCDCTKLKPELQELMLAIKKQHIPVFKMWRDANGEKTLSMAIHQRSMPVPYVAISHCWADGLGSSTEEGIYMCQAERISTLVRTFGEGGYFWIDSLCVPKDATARKESITAMKDVFRDAKRVLVLDESVRNVSRNCSPHELAWRVVASEWMQRLWTYQEAYLAEDIWIEMKDGPCDLDIIIREAVDKTLVEGSNQVLAPLLVTSQRLCNLRPQWGFEDRDRLVQWTKLLDEVKTRSTSHREDEFLAVAGMMDVDTAEIISLEADARAIKFFQLMGEVSWTILFVKKERIPCAPFRWLPRNLTGWMSLSMNPRPHLQPTATCSNRGLEVEIEFLEFDEDIDVSERIWEYLQVGSCMYSLSTDAFWLKPDPVYASALARAATPDAISAAFKEELLNAPPKTEVTPDANVLIVYYDREDEPPSLVLESQRRCLALLATWEDGERTRLTCHFDVHCKIQKMNDEDPRTDLNLEVEARWVKRSIIIT